MEGSSLSRFVFKQAHLSIQDSDVTRKRMLDTHGHLQVYYKRGDVPDLRAYETRLLEIRYTPDIHASATDHEQSYCGMGRVTFISRALLMQGEAVGAPLCARTPFPGVSGIREGCIPHQATRFC